MANMLLPRHERFPVKLSSGVSSHLLPCCLYYYCLVGTLIKPLLDSTSVPLLCQINNTPSSCCGALVCCWISGPLSGLRSSGAQGSIVSPLLRQSRFVCIHLTCLYILYGKTRHLHGHHAKHVPLLVESQRAAVSDILRKETPMLRGSAGIRQRTAQRRWAKTGILIASIRPSSFVIFIHSPGFYVRHEDSPSPDPSYELCCLGLRGETSCS